MTNNIELMRIIDILQGRISDLEQIEYRVPHTGHSTISEAQSKAISTILGIPGLRGFWPCTVASATGQLIDLSGNDLHMDRLGGPLFYQWTSGRLLGSVFLDGTGDYFRLTDSTAIRITGTETYIPTVHKGLALGAWVYFNNTASSLESIFTKRLGGTQLSFYIRRLSSGKINFEITSDGTGGTVKNVESTGTIGQGVWTFIAARFDPSTELKVWINETTDVNTSSIPASIHAGTANINLGGRDDGSDLMDGSVALVWYTPIALLDDYLSHIYNITQPLFY